MTAPRGAAEGSDGAKAISRILRRDGREEVIPSKQMLVLHAGDRLIVETAGGAGYGNPRERLQSLSRADHANGKIT